MSLRVLDSVNPYTFQGLKFDGLAGYNPGGSWPDFSLECELYPELHKQNRIISIAITSYEDAEACDCESGDLSPSEVPAWVERQLARKVWRPVVYSSASVWQSGLAATLSHHGDKIRRWVADWTYVPEIAAGFDMQQWTDHYMNRNIDGNDALANFFAPAPQPPHKNEPNYDWFSGGPFVTRWGVLHERNVVEAYDELRKHTKEPLELAKLESRLKWLAQRDAFEAIHHPLKNHHPSWSQYHRGWRYQQLIRRSLGQRFV